MALVGDNQKYKQGVHVLDKAIFTLYSANVLSETDQRFQIYKPGQLSRAFLKKQGLKLPNDPESASDAQLEAHFEFENWQSALNEQPPNFPCNHPRLEIDVAFEFEGGTYARIREHDVPAREQKPCAARHPP
jgi:hypothetical protein